MPVYACHGLVYHVLLILSEVFFRSTYWCYCLLYLFLLFHICRNPEFQQSVKELKEKAGELKGVKEEFKDRYCIVMSIM